MIGGKGADGFYFKEDYALDQKDIIRDFEVGKDHVYLSAAKFPELGVAVDASEFVIGNAATLASHHLIYNEDTGILSYDKDGVGGVAAVELARIGKHLALTYHDFEMAAWAGLPTLLTRPTAASCRPPWCIFPAISRFPPHRRLFSRGLRGNPASPDPSVNPGVKILRCGTRFGDNSERLGYRRAMSIITKTADLAAVCKRLAHFDFVTVDTEFMRETTYWPELCLIQVASPDEAVIVDALSPELDLEPFFKLMKNEKIIKVFHAARQDIEIVYHLGGLFPTPSSTPRWPRWSAVLAIWSVMTSRPPADRCALDKTSRFTDWRRRPLTDISWTTRSPTSPTCATSIGG